MNIAPIVGARNGNIMYRCKFCKTIFDSPKLIDDFEFGVIFPEKGWNYVCPCCETDTYYLIGESDEN